MQEIKLKEYIIRKDKLLLLFSEDIPSTLLLKGRATTSSNRVIDGKIWKEINIERKYLPLDLQDLTTIEDQKEKKIKNLSTPSFFKNQVEYEKSNYTWGANRHKDAETNAFICKQLIEHSELLTHTKFSLSVILGYKSLELQDTKLINNSIEMIESLYPQRNKMKESPSVRENKHHLIFSSGYVLQLLYIYKKDLTKLFETWLCLLKEIKEIRDKEILRTSIINITNTIILISINLHLKNEKDLRNKCTDLNLSLFRKGVSFFQGDFDIVHLKELDVVHRSVSLHQVLKKINHEEQEITNSLQHHFGIKSTANLIEKLFKSSLRTKGDVNEKIKSNIAEIAKEIDRETLLKIEKEIFSLTSNKTPQGKIKTNITSYGVKEKNEADLIRDLGLAFEKNGDIKTAQALMKLAHQKRPTGPFIIKKLNEYEEKIINKNQEE